MNAFSTFTRSAWIASYLVVLATTSSLAADKVIKIGGLLPMSGPGSYFGAQDKQGVELALDQLNKSGVNGYKFEIRYEDSACGPLAREPGRKTPDRRVQA